MAGSDLVPSDLGVNGGEMIDSLASGDDPRIQLANDLAGLRGASSVHNFEGSETDKWRMITLAENDSVPGSEYAGGPVFMLKYWYLHRIKLVDAKTGEVTEPIRTVLLDNDGLKLHFVSDGIAKSMAKIIQVFGVGPYTPPIPLEIMEIRTRLGFKTLVLVPAKA